MKSRGRLPIFSLALLVVGPVLALAQAIDCPSVIRNALAITDQICESTGRNQACYGNVTLVAEPQTGISKFQFDKPGDLVNVAQVKTLRLSALDMQTNVWGVALMRIQANVPDTLPGQNVTFLLFGDVEIQNAGQVDVQPKEAEVTALKAIIVYERPLATSTILAGIIANGKVIADGRSPDNLWLHISLPDDSSKYGWIRTDNLTGADFNQLPVIDSEAVSALGSVETFSPMQAFYFKSGFHDRPCTQAPDSGILIQAPENAGPILLRVNDVDITLGSTAYFQAQASGEMTISVIEGAALVEANGEARAVPAGTQVRVPLDANLEVSGLPSQTESYDNTSLKMLPIQNLDKPIVVAPALTTEQINQLNKPRLGVWQQTSNVVRACPDGTLTHEFWEAQEIAISDVNQDDFLITLTYNLPYVIQFTRSETGITYFGHLNYLDSIPVNYEYQVLSPEHIVGQLSYTQDNCAYNISREMLFVRADAA